MRDVFKTIQTEISELERSLAYQVPFFRTKGNVYLVTGNTVKDNYLLRKYIELAKFELNFEDLQKLSPITKTYRRLLAILALNMQKDTRMPALEAALDPEKSQVTGEKVIEKYARIRQQTQKLLTELNAYTINNFSLKVIPPVFLQEDLLTDLQGLNFATDEVDLIVDMSKLKVEGLPDLVMTKDYEQQTRNLSLQISRDTDVIRTQLYLEEIDREAFDYELLSALITSALSSVYTDLYHFLYDQIKDNGLTAKESLANLQQKVPDVKGLLLLRLEQQTKEIAAQLSKSDQQLLAQLYKPFVETYKKEVISDYLFNFSEPVLYNLELRRATKFETQVFEAFFGIDIWLMEEFTAGEKLILSTMAMVYGPKVYQLGAVFVCGYNHNWEWVEETLLSKDMNALERYNLKTSNAAFASQRKVERAAEMFQYLTEA